MMLTRNNLNEVLFENQDAKLIIEDIITHTQAILYYYGEEITVLNALHMWNNAQEAEESNKQHKEPLFKYNYCANQLRCS